MDLEQRVKALEQELQVLKNQVQATLLDIQDHLLTNTYPTLRAEDTPAPNAAPSPAAPAQAPAASRPAEPPRDTPAETPVVRKVSLDDLAQSAPAPTPPPAPVYTPEPAPAMPEQRRPAPPPPPAPAPAPARVPGARVVSPPAPAPPAVPSPTPVPGLDWETLFTEDDEAASFDTPPVARTRGTSSWSRPEKPAPLTVTDVPDIKVRPFVVDEELPPAAAADDIPITEADWATLEQLEDWTSNRVAKLGARGTRDLINRYVEEGRISYQVKDALLQLVSIIAEGLPASDPAEDTKSSSPSRKNGKGKNEPEADGVSPRLIQRLIAGLESTGKESARRTSNG